MLNLIIAMNEVALGPSNIDALASEFYGEVLTFAGDTYPAEITVEFKTFEHPVGKVMVDAKECFDAFKEALDCFRIKI